MQTLLAATGVSVEVYASGYMIHCQNVARFSPEHLAQLCILLLITKQDEGYRIMF